MKIQKLFFSGFILPLCYALRVWIILDTESPSIPSDENLFKSTALTEAAPMGVYATNDGHLYIWSETVCQLAGSF